MLQAAVLALLLLRAGPAAAVFPLVPGDPIVTGFPLDTPYPIGLYTLEQRAPIPELTNLIGFDQNREERLTVAETQAGLSRLGYKIGKVDGKLGPITAAAIKAFQRDQNMKVSGKTSQALLAKIKATIAALPPPGASGQSDHAVGE